jgi:hypothetical protein
LILGGLGGETLRRVLAFHGSSELILEQETMEYLRALTIFIFSASRVPQIYSNFANKSTGALSLPTLIMQFAGALARVFTTLADKKNYSQSVLLSFLIAAALSGTLILQILLYWDNTNGKSKEKPKKAKTDQASKPTAATGAGTTTTATEPKKKKAE